MRVPAVVGSWPRAVRARLRAERLRAEVECATRGPAPPATTVAERGCASAGATWAGRGGPRTPALRVLVGPWARFAARPGRGADRGGPGDERRLRRFDRGGTTARSAPRTRRRRAEARSSARAPGWSRPSATATAPPTWLVTGTDDGRRRGAAAACSTRRDLRDHYAVAVDGGDAGMRRCRWWSAMRSPLAYVPRPRPAAATPAPLARGRSTSARSPSSPSSSRTRSCWPRPAARRGRGRPRSPGRARRAARSGALGPGARRADRRRQRASSRSAATPCWPRLGDCRCWARSTSPPRRSPTAACSRCGSSSC